MRVTTKSNGSNKATGRFSCDFRDGTTGEKKRSRKGAKKTDGRKERQKNWGQKNYKRPTGDNGENRDSGLASVFSVCSRHAHSTVFCFICVHLCSSVA